MMVVACRATCSLFYGPNQLSPNPKVGVIFPPPQELVIDYIIGDCMYNERISRIIGGLLLLKAGSPISNYRFNESPKSQANKNLTIGGKNFSF